MCGTGDTGGMWYRWYRCMCGTGGTGGMCGTGVRVVQVYVWYT